MHEIITLQLGQRANYLATHFWNTQESYFTYSSDHESIIDHDIHFRPGIGADGTETFTPRTVIYDLKGGFGSLRKINALYEIDEPVVPQGLWNRPTIIQRLPLVEQNPYQASLETGEEPPELTTSSVKYWSDFNRVYFHPKSIVQLNEYELSSSLMPFENRDVGDDLFNTLDIEHDLLDRDVRPFAEEADHMQGIQIMSGTDDAWGGFAARYLDRIRDEYGKTAVSFWGLEDGLSTIPREKRFTRLSNTARSISEIATQASLFIPMSLPTSPLPPCITLDSTSKWHTSSLFSTALESMTLPSRLKSGGRETLDQLVNALNINGNQNIAKLRMSVIQPALTNGHGHSDPEPEFEDSRLPSQERRGFHRRASPREEQKEGSEEKEPEVFDIDFFPTETGETAPRSNRRVPKKAHIFGQSESYRTAEDNEKETQDRQQVVEEDAGFARARRRAAGLAIVERHTTPLPFPLLSSFPRIFTLSSPATQSLNINTSLSTDSSISLRIKELQRVVTRGRGVGMNEREALGHALGSVAEAYEEGWSSGSDSDGDDD